MVVKILANGAGPWNYWVGVEWRWNNFDFLIVALSLPFVESQIAVAMDGNSGALMVLRLFRLARYVGGQGG